MSSVTVLTILWTRIEPMRREFTSDMETKEFCSMETMYYIGLDVHKKTISYCVKDGSGCIHAEGAIPATRSDLDRWMRTLPQPWTAAMEATLFTGWIYDHLKPHATAVKVAHPLMLRAIAAAKKKNDRIDANKITDCLRCDFLPECYMASTEIRERLGNNREPSDQWRPDESLSLVSIWCRLLEGTRQTWKERTDLIEIQLRPLSSAKYGHFLYF